MAPEIQSGEEAFARIFHDIEMIGVPIYRDMLHAIIDFSRSDTAACAKHVASIASELRVVMGTYMDNMHDKVIAHSIWLSRIQGFYGWGIGHFDAEKNEWERYDGLSGNHILLFQALDVFLGIEQYLSRRDQERSLPRRQRELCHALKKHSFRGRLREMEHDGDVVEILRNFDEILKRLRVRLLRVYRGIAYEITKVVLQLFRATHRMRSKMYLSQPAPERLPMTAGKSLLSSNIEESLEYLDGFMVRRLAQTV